MGDLRAQAVITPKGLFWSIDHAAKVHGLHRSEIISMARRDDCPAWYFVNTPAYRTLGQARRLALENEARKREEQAAAVARARAEIAAQLAAKSLPAPE